MNTDFYYGSTILAYVHFIFLLILHLIMIKECLDRLGSIGIRIKNKNGRALAAKKDYFSDAMLLYLYGKTCMDRTEITAEETPSQDETTQQF